MLHAKDATDYNGHPVWPLEIVVAQSMQGWSPRQHITGRAVAIRSGVDDATAEMLAAEIEQLQDLQMRFDGRNPDIRPDRIHLEKWALCPRKWAEWLIRHHGHSRYAYTQPGASAAEAAATWVGPMQVPAHSAWIEPEDMARVRAAFETTDIAAE